MAKRDPEIFMASRPDQQAALNSPIRLEILGQFLNPGGMSVSEIAERMGRPASTLYYHFRLMEQAGLLVRVGSRPGTKRSEALYEPVAPRVGLAADSSSESGVRAVVRAMRSAFRMAERDLEAALTEGPCRTEGEDRNLYATRMHCRITKKTLSEVNHHLQEIDRILDREARRKRLPPDADQYCSLTLALLPLRGRDSG